MENVDLDYESLDAEAQVYRYFLCKSEKQVRTEDPLVEAALGGPSIDYGEEIIVFDKKNPLGPIIDEETEESQSALNRSPILSGRRVFNRFIAVLLSGDSAFFASKDLFNVRQSRFSIDDLVPKN